MPFCILIGAMSCYLNLSRRHELVVARAAGMSAWQFVSPALIVAFAARHLRHHRSTIRSRAMLQEQLEALRGRAVRRAPDARLAAAPAARSGSASAPTRAQPSSTPSRAATRACSSDRRHRLHLRQRRPFHGADRGARGGARAGRLAAEDARVYPLGRSRRRDQSIGCQTNLTPEQVRESFATPETVPFWELPQYIRIAEHAGLAAAGYRLQFQKLLARPFLLAAMVFLAAAVSLRFFRFGGVQKMVLSGVAAGFLLYVMSKVTDDLSKAELMHPVAAAWLPVLVRAVSRALSRLLYQEDG